MFARMRIATRINVTVVLAAAGILAAMAISLWVLRAQMLEDRRTQLRNILDATLSVATAAAAAAGGFESQAGRAAFSEALNSTRFGSKAEVNFVFAYDRNGVALSHLNPRYVGMNRLDEVYSNGEKMVRKFKEAAEGPSGTGFFEYPSPKGAGGAVVPKLALIQNVPGLGFGGVGIYIDDVDAVFMRRLLMLAGVVGAVLLAIAVTNSYIGRSISVPLASLSEKLLRVAKGDLDSPVADESDTSEVGEIARAAEVLRQNTIERNALQARVGAGQQRQHERELAFERHAKQFQAAVTSAVGSLRSHVQQLRTSAESLADSAERATFQAAQGANVSTTAADNSNAVAAATEQLSCSIREISGQAQRTNAVVEAAGEEASRTNADVASLASAAEQIGSIVAVIRGIADQTNLLALNATIEAARAQVGPGLRGGRRRGEGAVGADRQGDRRDRRSDPRHPKLHGDSGERHSIGGGQGRGDPGLYQRDCGGRGGADRGGPGDREQCRAGGRGQREDIHLHERCFGSRWADQAGSSVRVARLVAAFGRVLAAFGGRRAVHRRDPWRTGGPRLRPAGMAKAPAQESREEFLAAA